MSGGQTAGAQTEMWEMMQGRPPPAYLSMLIDLIATRLGNGAARIRIFSPRFPTRSQG